MMVMGFARSSERIEGRRVRRAIFEPRSSLPVTAACVVANGVRERLGALLGTPVSLRLLEPRLPDERAWHAIAADALIFRARGTIADAAFVLRPLDALAIAAAAFGELPGDPRPLSPVEERVVTRAVAALTSTLGPVCGMRDGTAVERLSELRGYTTYFELLLERPAAARIGVALSRDPVPEGHGSLCPQDLLDIQVEVSAEFARGRVDAAALLALHPGAEVPMTTKVGAAGLLKVAGTIVAHGECGSVGGRYAMVVRDGWRRA
ncbi:MAG: FliM/FliN family flagellar motor C-terminal domain-containing protein [Vulcanimicrobiaceae bacterium]